MRLFLEELSFLLVQKLTLWRRRWNERRLGELLWEPGKGAARGWGETVEWPRGCGLQAAWGRMSFSCRLARGAAAKGGREELKMGSQD